MADGTTEPRPVNVSRIISCYETTDGQLYHLHPELVDESGEPWPPRLNRARAHTARRASAQPSSAQPDGPPSPTPGQGPAQPQPQPQFMQPQAAAAQPASTA